MPGNELRSTNISREKLMDHCMIITSVSQAKERSAHRCRSVSFAKKKIPALDFADA